MKILISADMEGVTGVTNWDQVTPVLAFIKFANIIFLVG